MSSRPAATRFAAALQRAGSQLPGSGVRLDALQEDARSALQFAGRLHEYRQYLSKARAFKAASAGASGEAGRGIDAEVLAHGRQALADARGFAGTGLRVMRSLHRGGALSRQVAVWRNAIQETGAVSIVGEWAGVSGLPELQAGFDEIGASRGVLASIDEAIRQTNAEVTIDAGHLIVKSIVAGRRLTGMMSTVARPAMPANVADLVTRGRFERMVDAVARGEPAFLEGVGVAGLQEAGLPEVALHDGLAVHREVVRHVRKLEDTGLATYRGGEPGTIFLIGLAVAIVGIAFAAKYCDDHPVDDPDETKCALGKILSFIAWALMLGAAKRAGIDPPDPPPPSLLTMGGPVMHGLLRDSTKTAIQETR